MTTANCRQSFSLFLPTIIKALGYTSTVAQLFTVPPNMCSFFVVLITAWYSDRIKMRAPFMIAGCLVAIAGYAMLLGSEKNAVRYAGTFFVACGVFQGSPMVSMHVVPKFVTNDLPGHGLAVQQFSTSLRKSDSNWLPGCTRKLRCFRGYLYIPQ